jgi:hypothetical protein
MKRKSVVLIGWFLFGVSVTALSQSMPTSVIDPFFGITYNPAVVHLENMPSTIGKQCQELQGWRYVHAWVYSQVRTTDAEYFIVYGYVKVADEDHPGALLVAPEDDDGLIIEIRPGKCRVDQWQFVLRKETHPTKEAAPMVLPDRVLDALAAELFDRYARAFGGKEKFLSRVSAQAKGELPPILRQQLNEFERK